MPDLLCIWIDNRRLSKMAPSLSHNWWKCIFEATRQKMERKWRVSPNLLLHIQDWLSSTCQASICISFPYKNQSLMFNLGTKRAKRHVPSTSNEGTVHSLVGLVLREFLPLGILWRIWILSSSCQTFPNGMGDANFFLSLPWELDGKEIGEWGTCGWNWTPIWSETKRTREWKKCGKVFTDSTWAPSSFQVRSKQENQLKVRNFLPPQSQDPEIYLVEKFGSARSNNEADYQYGGQFADAEGAFINQRAQIGI